MGEVPNRSQVSKMKQTNEGRPDARQFETELRDEPEVPAQYSRAGCGPKTPALTSRTTEMAT